MNQLHAPPPSSLQCRRSWWGAGAGDRGEPTALSGPELRAGIFVHVRGCDLSQAEIRRWKESTEGHFSGPSYV